MRKIMMVVLGKTQISSNGVAVCSAKCFKDS